MALVARRMYIVASDPWVKVIAPVDNPGSLAKWRCYGIVAKHTRIDCTTWKCIQCMLSVLEASVLASGCSGNARG